MNIEKTIIEVLDRVGIFIDVNIDVVDGDIDLRNYIFDSLQFITFIVEMESTINIPLPDDFLIFDNFSSLKALSQNINTLLLETDLNARVL